MFSKILSPIRRLARAEDGVALVEFAMVLPLFLAVFGVIVSGSRMMWSYQLAISGVRDATRFLARAAPANICTTSGSVAGYTTQLTNMVSGASTGGGILPVQVTLDQVTPSYRCVTGSYHGGTVAVAQVSAQFTFGLPFANLLSFFGAQQTSVTTTVTDQARIFGT